eukprot:SM002904S10816  [mRNA]  locus=s2904:267:1549:- [translate_table: standard]
MLISLDAAGGAGAGAGRGGGWRRSAAAGESPPPRRMRLTRRPAACQAPVCGHVAATRLPVGARDPRRAYLPGFTAVSPSRPGGLTRLTPAGSDNQARALTGAARPGGSSLLPAPAPPAPPHLVLHLCRRRSHRPLLRESLPCRPALRRGGGPGSYSPPPLAQPWRLPPAAAAQPTSTVTVGGAVATVGPYYVCLSMDYQTPVCNPTTLTCAAPTAGVLVSRLLLTHTTVAFN